MKRNNDEFYYEIIAFDEFNHKKNYGAILIIIDCLIKDFHIVFFKKNHIVKQFEYIVLNRLIKYHKLLKKITNDKNKLFIANY